MSVVTVGNFDGVHLGHRHLIEKMRTVAAPCGERVTVITFEMHPKNVLSDNRIKVLTDNNSKRDLLLKYGADDVIFLDFNNFSSFSGEEFLKYLKDNFSMSSFVCGEDFRFGKNAEGNVSLIKKLAEKLDFNAEILHFNSDEKISSSAIRKMISEGDMTEASNLLGYRFFVKGGVFGGKHIGRELGFPTINIFPSENIILPKYGVYATDIILGDKKYRAVSNVGVRPTFEKTEKANIETYVLSSLSEDNYTEASVIFKSFIRAEKKFKNPEALAEQISKDCEVAGRIV